MCARCEWTPTPGWQCTRRGESPNLGQASGAGLQTPSSPGSQGSVLGAGAGTGRGGRAAGGSGHRDTMRGVSSEWRPKSELKGWRERAAREPPGEGCPRVPAGPCPSSPHPHPHQNLGLPRTPGPFSRQPLSSLPGGTEVEGGEEGRSLGGVWSGCTPNLLPTRLGAGAFGSRSTRSCSSCAAAGTTCSW